MEVPTIYLGLAVVAVVGVVVGNYLVNIQTAKAAINKEARGIALDTVFKQFGLNRQGVKFWNDLTPQGAATLIATLRAVQQSSGQGMGGQFAAGIQKQLAELAALGSMIPQNVPQTQAQS